MISHLLGNYGNLVPSLVPSLSRNPCDFVFLGGVKFLFEYRSVLQDNIWISWIRIRSFLISALSPCVEVIIANVSYHSSVILSILSRWSILPHYDAAVNNKLNHIAALRLLRETCPRYAKKRTSVRTNSCRRFTCDLASCTIQFL